jgi:hypothetical protein
MCYVSYPSINVQDTADMSEDLHWWDWTTPIEEIMQGLNNLVKAGKGMFRFTSISRVLG